MSELAFTSDESSSSSTRIVGRRAELDRIVAVVSSARTEGGVLLLTGEPGVGKTRLLDAAAQAASALGTRVLNASGFEFEADMSFSALNQVLMPLIDEM